MMQKKNIYLPILWIFFGTISRLIPHPPNVTPLTNLCLFTGSQLPKKYSIITIIISLFLSDIALHYIQGYPLFGAWTFFNYSAFVIITLLGSYLSKHFTSGSIFIYVLSSSFGFWLWTNFGTWLTSNLYPKTFSGFIYCYTMALPFLRNAILGDLIWMIVIFGGYKLLSSYVKLSSENFA